MLTKKRVLELIEEYRDLVVSSLDLENTDIVWHVYKTTDKAALKAGFTPEGCAAQCIWNDLEPIATRQYSIGIFYDKQRHEKDAIGSIVHELLHIRIRTFDRLIKESKTTQTSFHIKEEAFVSDLEDLLMIFLERPTFDK